MDAIPPVRHPDLLVGFDTSDDAGVVRLRDDLALVQTVDFITPIVDDPFTFGAIAAANSLSDVWAMGGDPLTALNVLCFPSGQLPLDVAREILRGGFSKVEEAGALLVGGHSIKDTELKYGLSVTGTVRPDRVWTNRGARPGDVLVLTKPIGTGILATALKGGMAPPGAAAALASSAAALNRVAAETARRFDVHACTDITGFGLGGHLLEVARGSGVEIRLRVDAVPLLEGALDCARQGLAPAGTQANRRFCLPFTGSAGEVAPEWEDLVFDPQTSGGLAFFLAPGEAARLAGELVSRGVTAAVIGEVSGEAHCGRLTLL